MTEAGAGVRRMLQSTTVELIDLRLRNPSSLPPRFDEVFPWWKTAPARHEDAQTG